MDGLAPLLVAAVVVAVVSATGSDPLPNRTSTTSQGRSYPSSRFSRPTVRDTGYPPSRSSRPTFRDTAYPPSRSSTPTFRDTGYPPSRSSTPTFRDTGYPPSRSSRPQVHDTGYPPSRSSRPQVHDTGYPPSRFSRPQVHDTGYPPSRFSRPSDDNTGFRSRYPPPSKGGYPPPKKDVFPLPIKGGYPPPKKDVFPIPIKDGYPPPKKDVFPLPIKGGYPPPKKDIFPLPSKGGYPPPKNDIFPLTSKGGYPPPKHDGYPPPKKDGYPPPKKDGYPPPSKGGYPPPKKDGYPPPKKDGYPPPSKGGYPPPKKDGYPPPSEGGYPPPSKGGYPPPSKGGYPPPSNGGYPQPFNGGGFPFIPSEGKPLDDLDMLYSRLDNVLRQLKFAMEVLDSLEARLSLQKDFVDEFSLSITQLQEIDIKQNPVLDRLEADLYDILAVVEGGLLERVDALGQLNLQNLEKQIKNEDQWASERARNVRQERAIANLFSSSRDFKDHLSQINENDFAVFSDSVDRAAELHKSTKKQEVGRKCEVGRAHLKADDGKAEYTYQTAFGTTPQVVWGLCDFNSNLDSRPDFAAGGSGYPSEEPNAIGLRVSAYSSKTTLTLKLFDLGFGDSLVVSADVCFQACSIGPGIGSVGY